MLVTADCSYDVLLTAACVTLLLDISSVLLCSWLVIDVGAIHRESCFLMDFAGMLAHPFILLESSHHLSISLNYN